MSDSYPTWLDDRPISGTRGTDLLGFRPSAQWLARGLSALRTDHSPVGAPWDGRWGRPARNNVSVTLEGPWGSGKTSYANLVVDALVAADDASRDPLLDEPVRVEFNVWQSGSIDISPWSALCYRVGEAFYARLHERAVAAETADRKLTLADPVRLEAPLISVDPSPLAEARLHWVEVARRLSAAIPGTSWHPCLNLFGDAPSKVPGRGASWSEALREGPRLAGAVVKALLGGVGAVSAVSDGVSSAGELLRRPTETGPSWGVDSKEFVRDLDRLLHVLHPRPRSWRLLLLVEDVTRLDASELPRVLDALGYVRRLSDIVSLTLLDDHIVATLEALAQRRVTGAQRVELPPAPGGEQFVTKLVGLRQRVPQPLIADISALVARWWGSLDLQHVAARGGALATSRRLVERGIRTPRQVKRALRALWMRLADEDYEPLRDAIASGAVSDDARDRIVGLHVDLHAFGEGRLDGALLLERAQTAAADLLALPIQPWDGSPWLDRQYASLLAVEWPLAQELVAGLRLIALAHHVRCLEPDHPLVASGRQAWASYRTAQGRAGDDPLQLALLTGADAIGEARLLAHLEARLTEENAQLTRQLVTPAVLAVAARRYRLADDDPAPATIPEILDSWFDGDALVQAIMKSAPRSPEHAMALTLLHLFNEHMLHIVGHVTSQAP